MGLEELVQKIEFLKNSGEKIVFTNGCFDILHAGHVRYLTEAKAQGGRLVVGLNSDRSVKSIKDPGRPITDQAHRAEVISGLGCVDFIVIFDESDPQRLIERIGPDVLVKGADWAESEIVGATSVKAKGGRVARIPLVRGISTTDIIGRILDRYCPATDAGGDKS